MKIVLGIDGGGSKVSSLVANENGEILGHGIGGPINTNYVLYKDAIKSTCQAIETALQGQADRRTPIEALVISAPMDPGTLNEIVRQYDIHQVVRAAEGETPRWTAKFWIADPIGVTVDAGTGSLSRGWSKDGREAGAGGFGATIGDEGSGMWIGLKAIAAVFQSYDGRLEETKLTQRLLDRLGLGNVQELLFRTLNAFIPTDKLLETLESQERTKFVSDSGHSYDQGYTKDWETYPHEKTIEGGLIFQKIEMMEPLNRQEISSLCPLVVDVARQGDRIARKILEDAGTELGRLATSVIRRLGMEEDRFAIVPFGGVFKGGDLILRTFQETCQATAPNASIVFPKFEPEVGAVLIALDLIGIPINREILRRIEISSQKFPACRR